MTGRSDNQATQSAKCGRIDACFCVFAEAQLCVTTKVNQHRPLLVCIYLWGGELTIERRIRHEHAVLPV